LVRIEEVEEGLRLFSGLEGRVVRGGKLKPPAKESEEAIVELRWRKKVKVANLLLVLG
jgi:hypothetical protein